METPRINPVHVLMFRKRELLFVISLLFLFFFPVIWGSWNVEARIASILFLLLSGSACLSARSALKEEFQVPKAIIPFGFYLMFQAGLLFISPNPVTGSEKILTNFVTFVCFILFFESLSYGWPARAWENALIAMAIIISLLGLFILFIWLEDWWRVSGKILSFPPTGVRLPGVMVDHPNLVGGFINLAIPVALIRLKQKNRKWGRIFWLATIIVLLISLYFTSSRGAWIGLIIGLVVMVGLINAKRASDFAGRFRRGLDSSLIRESIKVRNYWIAAFAVVIGAGTLYLFSWNTRYVGHGGISFRLELWGITWNQILSSPILGHGPGAYPMLSSLNSDKFIDPNWYFHPHNFWLQIGFEAGLTGILLVLLFMWLATKGFIAAWRNAVPGRGEKAYLAAYAGAATSAAVQNVVDVLFFQMLYTLGIFLFLAIVLSKVPKHENLTLKRGTAVLTFLFLIGLASFDSHYSMRGGSDYLGGISEARRGDWALSRDKICRAADSNQSNTLFGFQCGLANGFMAYHREDTEALEAAAAYTQQALLQDPYWFGHWANLASYEWGLGKREEALSHMQRAVDGAPREEMLQINLGGMQEELGNQDAALESYRKALILDPGLQESIFFTRSQLRQKALQDLTSDDPLRKGWRDLKSDDVLGAENNFQQAVRLYPSNGLAYLSLAWAQTLARPSEEAWQNVETGLFLDSSSPWALGIAARVAQKQGRYQQAIDYLTKAFELIQNASLSREYYPAAYRQPYLPTNLSPFLIRADLTPEMLEGFRMLEENLRVEGETEKLEALERWIQKETLQVGEMAWSGDLADRETWRITH